MFQKNVALLCVLQKKGVKIGRKAYYKYSYPRYTLQPGSVITAIHNVDGCNDIIDLAKKYGIIKLSTSKELFTSACNSHDVCYDCLKGKSYCDKKFRENMNTLCRKKYTSGSATYKKCIHDADIFYYKIPKYI